MTTAQRHAVGSPSPAERMRSRLLVLTDRSQLPLGRSLLSTLADCVAAGATVVVVRELDLADDHRAALAHEIADLGATVIAAHRPLPAAVGVHLPAGAAWPDADGAPRCKAPLSPLSRPHGGGEEGITARYMVVGRSCHTPEDVRRAAAEGASYATLGPFAETRSKPGYRPIEAAAFAVPDLPTYALGGIDEHNAAAAREAGAYGVAVMGAIMRAADPGAVVTRLLEEVAR